MMLSSGLRKTSVQLLSAGTIARAEGLFFIFVPACLFILFALHYVFLVLAAKPHLGSPHATLF
jgi:hypothetical protein